MTNPILKKWQGPFGGVPNWDEYKPEMMDEAVEEAITRMTIDFEDVLNNERRPNFYNTFVSMNLSGKDMANVLPVWGVYSSNLSNAEVQIFERKWGPKISEFYNKMALDPRWVKRVEAVYQNMDSEDYDEKQRRIITDAYQDLQSHGAFADEPTKARLIEIGSELEALFTDFSNFALGDEMDSIDPFEELPEVPFDEVLDGLSDGYVASIRKQDGDDFKYLIQNTRSAITPILTNASCRELRELAWKKFTSRGNSTNVELIPQILKLRQERAELLGFKNHAEYRMINTMAKDPQVALDLLLKVWDGAVEAANLDIKDIEDLISREGKDHPLEPWDYLFYAEKVRKEKYDFDENEIRPYFQLDNMMDAMFWVAGECFNMEFRENTGEVPVFHPDVRTFGVYAKDTGREIGLFYLDNFARHGKRSGAWMTTYRSQNNVFADNVLASNNNNFLKAPDGPTLLSLDDAVTLFHEFGHALHYLSYDIDYPDLTEVPRDFVELPSQLFENWLMTPEVLNKFAVHVETGEPIPTELVDKIVNSQTFNKGFDKVEFLQCAIADMILHMDKFDYQDYQAYVDGKLDELGRPNCIEMRHRLPHFSHIFSSDAYSAGYYSYMWADVMVADVWETFIKEGRPFGENKTVKRYVDLLLKTGGETDRADAYREFRGCDPEVAALLRSYGFE